MFASAYGLSAHDVSNATVASVHDVGKGAIIVKFRQTINGIEVFRDELNVAMNRNSELVAISGHIPSTSLVASSQFRLGEKAAIAAALHDFTGLVLSAETIAATPGQTAGFSLFDVASTDPMAKVPEPAAVKKVFFRMPSGLVSAYYVILTVQDFESGGNDVFSYVISATDGSLLFRKNLTENDSYSYRVWADGSPTFIPQDGPQGSGGTPHPTGTPDGYQPPFVAPSLVTLQNAPFSQNDPWLPPGSVETTGNNVDAYVDLAAPDGLGAGDFRADSTSAGVFDRTYDVTQAPNFSTDQQKASIAQLFFDNNFLHDWFYDAGFDEAAGNAQTLNFGRGGVEGDSLRAEGQDYSGLNNANMSTPPDGFRPRMQMYVFTGVSVGGVTPSSGTLAGQTLQFGTAAWGPQAFDLTADLAYPAANQNGCSAFGAGEFAGKIAMLDRGTCSFVIKAQNAQDAGAVGLIVVNNQAGIVNMAGTGPTIPSLSILQSDGTTLKADLVNGPVAARMFREATVNRDGTLDNQIIAHEWGHYLSNRLVSNAGGLGNNLGRGMGEGWADFVALMMTVKPGDDQLGTNANFNGVYALAGYVLGGGTNNAYYYGIRRVPYSTDFAKNNLTYRIIANGNPISGIPCAFGCTGVDNAEVHNTGEVWSTMLWECYAALLRDTLGASPRLTFDQARDRMREYLVASLKMTPSDPTMLEARDAVLAAAWANDPVDFAAFAQAFAIRGAGIGALEVDRYDDTNGGGVLTASGESYVTGGDLLVTGTTLIEILTCDLDAILDDGETVTLMVTLKNTGTSTLSATTATLSSPTAELTFPSGNVINFPPMDPYGTSDGFIQIALNGVSGTTAVDINMSINDPGLVVPAPILATHSMRVNYDNLPASSATDDVESDITASTSDIAAGATGWSRAEVNALSHVWIGPDAGSVSDVRLVTPTLNVGNGTFSFAFQQMYDLESTFDGGVIEVSSDGGTTWVDASTIGTITPSYNGLLQTGGNNPLEGRNAYTGTQAWQAVTVDFGSALANQNVKVRWRIGTDVFVGGSGWSIDDIAFSGITNTPFATIVPNQGCVPVITSLSPNSTPAGVAQSVTITGTNFDSAATVTIGGNAVPSTWNSSTSITASAPAFASPGTLQDVVVTNPGGGAGSARYVVDFTDVPASHPFHNFVNAIFRNGITAGCGPGLFCPASPVTRAQMAVFLLVAEHGAGYVPPTLGGQMFADVPPGHPFKSWIEQLAVEGVTTGCGGGNYCPNSAVTREQMAVFLLVTKEGAGYAPPAAVGIFGDVPVSNIFARFIEELYNRGITGGCGGGNYCPSSPVTRGQMSVFLTTTFNLP